MPLATRLLCSPWRCKQDTKDCQLFPTTTGVHTIPTSRMTDAKNAIVLHFESPNRNATLGCNSSRYIKFHSINCSLAWIEFEPPAFSPSHLQASGTQCQGNDRRNMYESMPTRRFQRRNQSPDMEEMCKVSNGRVELYLHFERPGKLTFKASKQKLTKMILTGASEFHRRD